MNQNKLTFESEKLTVDWISFKFQHLENIEGIAYLKLDLILIKNPVN